MTGLPWWVWASGAALLAVLELHAPGAYLIWVALGAALTALVAGLTGALLEAQLGVFAAASIVSCIGGYFVYRGVSRPRRELPLNERDRLMIGARGTVCEAFSGGRGKVRLGDGVWLAEGPDLPLGAQIVVRGVRGLTVVVEAAPRAAAAASP
jgi:membrane protein implicated in regulation of membrane protease activity